MEDIMRKAIITAINEVLKSNAFIEEFIRENETADIIEFTMESISYDDSISYVENAVSDLLYIIGYDIDVIDVEDIDCTTLKAEYREYLEDVGLNSYIEKMGL